MSSSENPIVENDPILLKSMDEFESERTNLLVKLFHAEIKEQLKDPSKQFILLVNSDISYKKYVAKWSSDPNQKDKLFVELTEKEDMKNPVLPKEEMLDVPKLVPIYSVEANDYYTNPENGTQHFPENIFNYDNNNDWRSYLEGNKNLDIIFDKEKRIKYIVIDFLESATKQYSFEIGYYTGYNDGQGKPVINYIPDSNDSTKRLVVTTELKDELQYIEFGTAILTSKLILNFTSKEAGINYLFIIENDLSKEAIKAFLSLQTT